MFSVVLDAFLDNAFRRLAAKNQLSHCSKQIDMTHTTTVSIESPRAERTTNSNFKLRKSLEHACQLRSAELMSSIAH
jgi:hypothetical protein